MPNYFISIALFFVLINSAKAQLFDSIQDAFKFRPKIDAKLSAHNAFVANSFVKVNGVKLGLSFNKIVKLGLGYSWMQPYELKDEVSGHALHLNYGLIYFDYTFYRKQRWEMSIPIQIGYGTISYRDVNKQSITKGNILLYEPTMAFDYNFLRYFSAGIGYGYRIGIKSSTHIAEQFTSPIYTLRFKLKLGAVFKDISSVFLKE
jgi:hypothetical protein